MASTVEVSGSIESGSPLGPGLVVSLEDQMGHSYGMRTEVGPSGQFQFAGVPTGSYRLCVMDGYGNVLQQELVSVGRNMVPISIRMQQRRVERPTSGTISVARLAHKVPGKAQKEFEKALKAEKKNHDEEAIAHYEKAVQLDPEFIDAYNNLGARYLRAKQYDKALDSFHKAIALDAHSALPQVNAASTLVMMERWADAEQSARRAVDLDPNSRRARFILAISLIQQKKAGEEALDALNRASREFPKAHLMAAQVLASKGKTSDAKDEVQKYIDSGNKDELALANSWLAKLNGATGPAGNHQ